MNTELIRPGIAVCETWPKPISRNYLNTKPDVDLTLREFEDFVRRLSIAENLKSEMRRHYYRATRQRATFEDHQRRAREFWESYEEVNRKFVPEDPVYSKILQSVAASTTNDTWELGAASAGQTRILEHFVGGEATASAVIRVGVNRVTTQGTGTAPTAYTPEKFNTRSPAAAGTYYGAVGANVAWGTAQATLAANPMIHHAFNAFGGTDRWVAQPGEEIYLVNAEFASARSGVGTSVISAMAVVEEL